MQSSLLWLLLCVFPLIPGQAPKRDKQETGGKRIVCYYSNWSVYRPGTAKFSPQNINPYLCTHLIYAFGGIDKEHGLKPFDKYQDIEQGGYNKFNGLKAYNKALVTLLAIGGWNEGSARFSPLVADPERRSKFVKNAIGFLRQNHFDGLDLDWEYPTFRDGGKPHDRENYAKLVQELREEFEKEASKTGKKRLLLSMAVPAGIKYLDKGYDIPKLNKYLDFMNLLTYDYHSAFEPTVRHHSPLYNDDDEYNYDNELNIDSTVRHLLLKGASESKLVVGIPTYGRSYSISDPSQITLGSPADGPGEQGSATREKGFLAYHEICNSVKHDNWTVVWPKETAMGPIAHKGNQWVSYDDEAIVKTKAQYVKKRNLGGIMFWSLDNEDFRGDCHKRAYPLVEAGKEVLLGTSSNKQSTDRRTNKTKPLSKITTTSRATAAPSTTTPIPPTTPDPGSDFICKDEGFYPHPRDCKKYFWCLDSGPSNLGIVAHQFTCPSGLFFNKGADSCDYSRNVLCNKKKATTTTTAKPEVETSKSVVVPKTSRTTTTTTTTTTTAPEPEEELEEFGIDEHSEEDPETIRQLIALIKKLGGVAELEKQLEGNNSPDPNTKGISRSLVNRFIQIKPQSYYRNEALVPHDNDSELTHKEKKRPQYVSIRTQKHRNLKPELQDTETEEEEVVQEIKENHKPTRPPYVNVRTNKHRGPRNETTESPDEEIVRDKKKNIRPTRPQYVSIRNTKQRGARNETTDSPDEEIVRDKKKNIRPTRPQYVTIRSTKQRNLKTEIPVVEEVEEDFEEEEVEIKETPKPTRPPYVTLRSSRVQPGVSESQEQGGRTTKYRQKRPQYTNIRNQKPNRTRTKDAESQDEEPKEEEDEEEIVEEVKAPSVASRLESNKRSRPTYQRLNRFRPSHVNDLQDMQSTTSGISTETVIIRTTPTIKPTIIRQSTARNEPPEIQEPEEDEEIIEDPKENLKPSKPQYVTLRTNNYVTPRRGRPQSKVDEVISEDYYTDEIITEKFIETTTTTTTTTPAPTSSIIRLRRPTARAPFVRKLVATTTSTPSTRRIHERPSTSISRQRGSTSKYQERPQTQLLDDKVIKYTTLATPKRLPISPTLTSISKAKSTVRSNSARTSFQYDEYEDDYYSDPIDIPLSGKVRIHTDGYIECLDVGNFPHPFSCRKFISCAKMESNNLLGWEYTCPKGLSFDPIGSICNWNAGLGCKE